MGQGVTVVLEAPEQVGLHTYDLPEPGQGQVLVQMARANVCGSELHNYKGNHPNATFGGVMGHEGLGTIARLGPGRTVDATGAPISEGDRVVATYFECCRACPPCQRGDFNLCRNAYVNRWRPAAEPPHFHGTFGSHYLVHTNQYLYKVPDALSDRIAAGANCAVAQMLYAIEVAGLRPGETVLVQGAGGLGLAAVAAARATGCRIVVTEVAEERLTQARAFGAHDVIDVAALDAVGTRKAIEQRLQDDGVDAVMELTGVGPAMEIGVAALRPGGRYISVALGAGQPMSLGASALTRSGAVLRGVMRYQPWFLGKALAFLTDHADLPWERLIDAEYDLADVSDALADAGARRVVRPSLIPSLAAGRSSVD